MYGWLWRVMPGPVWFRALLLLLLAAAVVAACFTRVFPAIAPLMPSTDITVDE